MNAAAAPAVHVFERAGLGLAPFRFIGAERRVGPINLGNGLSAGAPGQPMGSCKFCGQGIADCYLIESADGKRFDVGSECVLKTGDRGLRAQLEAPLRAARKAAADRKRVRDLERVAAAFAELDRRPVLRELLAAQEAPAGTNTLLGWLEFVRQRGGVGGKLRAARLIESAIAGKGGAF